MNKMLLLMSLEAVCVCACARSCSLSKGPRKPPTPSAPPVALAHLVNRTLQMLHS